MALTAEQIADARCDLLDFSAIAFQQQTKTPILRNDHQMLICDALERVVLGHTNRLVINIPPRSGKTLMAVINFMAWSGGMFPDSEFIHASYSKRLATANMYAVRAMMQQDWYREIYPWTKLKEDSQAKDEFRTAQGGVFYATGSDGTITGYGAGKMRDGFAGAIIVDDPHKAGEALSDVMRANVIDWFQTTMESRKNRPDTPIIVIMQRLHEEDLTGWLLGGGNGEKWEHVCVPAINDNDRSFWERQFPIKRLHEMEQANRYVFAGQYMQNPIPKGGAMFNRDWFEVIPAAPSNCRWVRAWDLAATESKEAAFTAGVLMGKTTGGEYVIADVRRIQGNPAAVERLLKTTASQDGRGVRGSLPQDPGQAGKAQSQYLIKQLAGYDYHASPETGDKETRAMPLAAQAEVGNVKLVKGDWNKPFLDELSSFPVGKFKDQVDAASRAFDELVQGSTYTLANVG